MRLTASCNTEHSQASILQDTGQSQHGARRCNVTARTVASVAYGWMQYWTQDQGVTSVDVRVIYLYVLTNRSRLREHYQEQMQTGQEIGSDGKTGFECSREVAAGHMKTH